MNREAAQILSQNESQGNQNVLVEQNEPEQLINGIERVEQRNDEVLDKKSEKWFVLTAMVNLKVIVG